jgi:signal transduction histidine kinase
MKPLRFSLTFSILASLSCLLILTWLMLSLISFKTAEKDLLDLKSEEGRILLASFLTIYPHSPAEAGEALSVTNLAGIFASEPDFRGLLLVDQSGKQLYTLGDGKSMDARLLETVRTGLESAQFTADGKFVHRYAPLRVNGATTGAARLTFSLAREHERLNKSRHLYLAYFVLDFLLLLGFGSFLLSRTVIFPIRRLLAATERIASGDYGQTVHVPGSAEVANLAESFNTMVEALRNKRTEVELTVASLEQANRELHSAREETIRSEKMASVGLLAAGMAHEIGTPLAAIIGYVGILGDELQHDPVKSDYLSRIEAETARIDRIVRGLLDYAKPARASIEQVDIPLLAQETLQLLEGQGGLKQIDARFHADPGIPGVLIDPHLLQQVLINLMLNARDAMPDGGVLDVTVGVSPAGNLALLPAVMSGRRKGDPHSEDGLCREISCWVTIKVGDTGTGIAPESLDKIFEPFFSTKEPGKGTGLGLAISARIIDSFGGTITVESKVGEGSSFMVWLPVEAVNVA